MSYWDTSCLVKLYTPEHDSATFAGHLADSPRCVTADLTELEFWATVRRKETEGALAPGAAQVIQSALQADLQSGAIRSRVIDSAVRAEYSVIVDRCLSQAPPIFIRTNDALHLAAARCSGETELVATDKRLREAARMLGFTVFPPP